jgi:hypothetical protein
VYADTATARTGEMQVAHAGDRSAVIDFASRFYQIFKQRRFFPKN